MSIRIWQVQSFDHSPRPGESAKDNSHGEKRHIYREIRGTLHGILQLKEHEFTMCNDCHKCAVLNHVSAHRELEQQGVQTSELNIADRHHEKKPVLPQSYSVYSTSSTRRGIAVPISWLPRRSGTIATPDGARCTSDFAGLPSCKLYWNVPTSSDTRTCISMTLDDV